MGNPLIHAESSAKKFGGKAQDYIDIHEFIDSSGMAFPDLRHRALTHNTWFIKTMLPVKFGHIRKNSDGQRYSVVEVGQQHVLEDYAGKFIPDASDFLSQIRFLDWMDNAKGDSMPESNKRIHQWEKKGVKKLKSFKLLPRAPALPKLPKPSPAPELGEEFFSPRPIKRGCGGGGRFD
jgi:hypothetical protein